MYYSGICDEAGDSIETQIRAHQELGWKHVELRLVDGTNVTQLSDDDFSKVSDALVAAGMRVSCFGSAIGNWARPISGDLRIDIDDLQQAIPRMHQLQTQFIRVMSYPNDDTSPLPEHEWRRESIRRMTRLTQIAEDNGIVLCHENCSGWGGLSAENARVLLGEVDSPSLKLVFDTGNPVAYDQDSWQYYEQLRNDIVYVHIKDARIRDGVQYCFCGEGDGHVEPILRDLLLTGYDGGISIEPHLSSVIHANQRNADADKLFSTYTDYGRRLMALVNRLLGEIHAMNKENDQ